MTEQERKVLSGKRIQQIRKDIAKLSTEKFAELLDRAPKSIIGYEQGQTLIPVEQAAIISKNYNVSLDWLYGVTDEMNDDAGKMLSALCNYIENKEFNGLDPQIRIDSAVYKFISDMSEAKAFKQWKNLPENAYNAWVENIKDTFRKNYNKETENKNLPKTYYFVPEWVYKAVIPERRVMEPIPGK